MRMLRLVAMMLACLLILAPIASADYHTKNKKKKPQATMVKIKQQGKAYCFDRPMAVGNVVVAGGRCYNFYVMRTTGGSFLAFGPPGPPMIPPGQVVRLSTPAGAKVKGRLFYLVPVQAVVVPVNTIQYVPVILTPGIGRVVVAFPPALAAPAPERPHELVMVER